MLIDNYHSYFVLEVCITRSSISKAAEIELCIGVGAWVAMFI